MEQYIKKSEIVAVLESLRCTTFTNFDDGVNATVQTLLEMLDTLEVKEVDLEKELSILDNTLFDLDGVAVAGTTHYLTVEDVKYIAKHFFELGINAKGG